MARTQQGRQERSATNGPSGDQPVAPAAPTPGQRLCGLAALDWPDGGTASMLPVSRVTGRLLFSGGGGGGFQRARSSRTGEMKAEVASP